MAKRTKIFSVSLPKEFEREFEHAAKQNGKSRSAVVGEALRSYFLGQGFMLSHYEFYTQSGHKRSGRWRETLRKLNHLAEQGKQGINLADFIKNDRQAH